MAPFVNGTGGSLSGITSLEDWTFALLNFLRIQQGNSAKNPNSIKYLNINANTDGALTGTFSCPILIAGGAGGITNITASSYLQDVGYLAPNGGDSNAPNEVQALIDAVRRQRALELENGRNPTNSNYLSLSASMGSTGVGLNNGTISLGFAGLPADMSQGANGVLTIEGRTYLL
jgi:hypothetical protein